MKYVFVTLKIRESEIDLKVSGSTPLGTLLQEIGTALNINFSPNARVQAEPLGRILSNDKSLLAQEVYQGSVLTII